MITHTDTHSRSRLAGYQPERLFAAHALIVGVGALGQNLAINLSLAGVGAVTLVDDDHFLPHNATRSPLYPTPDEAARWGMAKSAVAAHKLLPMMTAPSPMVRYRVALLQEVGDGAIAAADIVFAAVDNAAARAYLSDRCRILGKPLVEAGFSGPHVTLALFLPHADAVCYRCGDPELAGAFSCTQYALQAAEEQIIPAIQNAAAVLAGMQAEQGIQWLHGSASLAGKRAYVNMRDLKLSVATLPNDPHCPGAHWTTSEIPREISVAETETVAALLAAVEAAVGSAEIRLPSPLILRHACVHCGALCDANVPEWRWRIAPRCERCGGPYLLAPAGRFPGSIDALTTDEDTAAATLRCADIGLPAGASFEAICREGERRLLRISGVPGFLVHALGQEAADIVHSAHTQPPQMPMTTR